MLNGARIRILLAILVGSLANSKAVAQENPNRANWWGAVGLGGALPTSGGDAITNMAQLVFQKAPHQAAIRALVLHDLVSAADPGGTDEIAELGILYGQTRGIAGRSVTFAAGVSAVAFDACPRDHDPCSSLGVPLMVEAALSGRLIGLGVQAFANVNGIAPYAGAALFLQFGRLPGVSTTSKTVPRCDSSRDTAR